MTTDTEHVHAPVDPWLRRTYLTSYAVNTLGAGLVYPLTALYLREVLDASLSLIGVYFVIVAISAMLINPVAGRRIDRHGAIPVTLTALSLQCLGAVALALSPRLEVALVAGFAAGLGNGAFFASQTPLLVRLFGRAELSRVFSSQYAIMNGMVALAGLTAGLMVHAFSDLGFRAAFAGNALTFVVYGLLTFGVVARRTTAPAVADTGAPRAPRALYPYKDRAFRPLIAAQFIMVMFGFAQMEAVAPLALREQGGFAVIVVTVMFTVNGVAVVLLQPRMRGLAERLGHVMSLRTAAVAWAASYLVALAAVLTDGAAGVALVVLFAIVFAVGEVLVAPSLQPLVAQSAPPEKLGTYAASISMTYSMSLAIGPAWGAPLTAFSPTVYWTVCAAGVMLLPVVLRGFRPGPHV